jgi:excisionase family DNA binding protein
VTVPKTISESSDLLSTSDVAEELGVHRSTVWGWIKNGMLPSEKHGSFHGVSPKALQKFRDIYQIEPKKKSGKKRRRKK